MTKSRRDELRRLREAATPGRWYVSNDSESGAVCHVDADHIPCAHIDCLESRDDAELVVAAHSALPELLDELDAKDARIAELNTLSLKLKEAVEAAYEQAQSTSLGIEHERRLDDIDAIACDISNALAAKPNGGG